VIEADEARFRDAARELRRGTVRLGRRLRSERPALGPSPMKVAVLANLRRLGPLSPGELAALEHIQPQSLTRTVTALERDGLITRRGDDEDRRRAQLEITRLGRGVIDADMHQRDLWLAAALRSLTPTERELLRLAGRLMQDLADADDQPGAGPPSR
jgi:DNA-binding MarR family transcriptional regulator